MIRKNNYKYGVELECIYDRSIRDSDILISKLRNINASVGNDSSIQHTSAQDGLEIRTNPLNFNNTAIVLKQIEDISREYKLTVNSSCGLHVHTSNPSFMEAKTLRKILGLWVAIEDVFFATQPESRLNSHYCKRRLASYAVAGFPVLPNEKQRLIEEMGHSDRYYALNFASLQRHGTIECRLHAGTLNTEKITNWITLLETFYDYAIHSYKGKDVDILFSMPTSEQKIKLAWELIGLKKDMREYFNARIDKFLVSKLEAQHLKAQEITKFRIDTAKEEENIKKTVEKSYALEDKALERADKMRQKAHQKYEKIRSGIMVRQRTLATAKDKLLREFVGGEFQGNISDLSRPWSSSSNSRRNRLEGIERAFPTNDMHGVLQEYYTNISTMGPGAHLFSAEGRHDESRCQTCINIRGAQQRINVPIDLPQGEDTNAVTITWDVPREDEEFFP